MNPKIEIEVTPELAAAVKARHDMLWDANAHANGFLEKFPKVCSEVCRQILSWEKEREILLSHGLSDALPDAQPFDDSLPFMGEK